MVYSNHLRQQTFFGPGSLTAHGQKDIEDGMGATFTRFHRLAVNYGCARFRIATFSLTHLAHQNPIDPLALLVLDIEYFIYLRVQSLGVRTPEGKIFTANARECRQMIMSLLTRDRQVCILPTLAIQICIVACFRKGFNAGEIYENRRSRYRYGRADHQR